MRGHWGAGKGNSALSLMLSSLLTAESGYI